MFLSAFAMQLFFYTLFTVICREHRFMGMNKTVRRLIEHYPFLKPLGGRFHSLPKTSLPALSSPDAKKSIFLEAISTLLPDLLTE